MFSDCILSSTAPVVIAVVERGEVERFDRLAFPGGGSSRAHAVAQDRRVIGDPLTTVCGIPRAP